MNLHIRIAGSSTAAETAMLAQVRAALKEADSDLPVLSCTSLRDFHEDGLVMWLFKTGARLFTGFALLALSLAAVGVYGVKAFVVARRTREIGIRIAIGATRTQVIWMVLRDGLRLMIAGLAVGAVLALGAGRLLTSVLFEVRGTDPISFGIAFVVLATASLLASYLPARRAARVNPILALRAE
jgi:ABC-type antimicrobial peptide transport system permease subunit